MPQQELDLDLLGQLNAQPAASQRKSELADALDLNVDLIVQQPGCDLPIYRIAKQHGVPL